MKKYRSDMTQTPDGKAAGMNGTASQEGAARQDDKPITRRRLLRAIPGMASALAFPGLVAAAGGAKRFSGTTLNVSIFSQAFPTLLRRWIPEFEAATGAKVNYDTPAFPIYNQRADLELSTHGSAYDVLNVTFIYSNRWISAGWFTPLDDYLHGPDTPSDWGLDDILAGARAPETGKDGKLYGIPWNVEVVLGGAARFDLVRKAGLDFPQTTDDFVKVLRAVNGKDDTAGFIADNHYGWTFPPYLHAFGGDVFRNAPDDLLPALDTPEAIAAADYFSGLLRHYGPDGAVSYTADQTLQALKTGRVNFSTIGQTYLAQLGTSRSAATAAFGLVPQGPKGRFPGVAVHGLGIPAGSKNKAAAWEFIKWATSKDIVARAVAQGYGSPARRSALESPQFKRRQDINGYDLSRLSIESVELAGKKGYMKYRTVSIYPQVDQQINKAIELIVSGQMSAAQAMKHAQQETVAELRRSGVRI